MSVLQGDDSTYRLVQNCAAAASAVIWNMEKRTQELYERFARQYVDRNEEWRGTLDGELTEAVLKQCKPPGQIQTPRHMVCTNTGRRFSQSVHRCRRP